MQPLSIPTRNLSVNNSLPTSCSGVQSGPAQFSIRGGPQRLMMTHAGWWVVRRLYMAANRSQLQVIRERNENGRP